MRKAGVIPAVVYGKEGSQPLSVSETEFMALWRSLHGGAALIEIEDDKGVTRLTQIRELQRDPIRDFIMHIDFNEVTQGESMTMVVPLHVTGNPKGVVDDGGVLESSLYEVEVRCLPKDLPDHLEINVSELTIGDSVHVSQIPLPEGVEILLDSDTTVASVVPPAPEEEEEPAAEELAPDEVPTVGEEEAEKEEESGESKE